MILIYIQIMRHGEESFNLYLMLNRNMLIYRILGTNSQLFKIFIEKSDRCRFCQSDSETFMHMFMKCPYVVELWKDLDNWIHSNLGKTTKYSPIDIILRYLHRDNQYILINTLIATTKYYIFKSAINNCVPNINGLKIKLKKKYEEQILYSLRM